LDEVALGEAVEEAEDFDVGAVELLESWIEPAAENADEQPQRREDRAQPCCQLCGGGCRWVHEALYN